MDATLNSIPNQRVRKSGEDRDLKVWRILGAVFVRCGWIGFVSISCSGFKIHLKLKLRILLQPCHLSKNM
jgi:hypothetical protein